MLRKYDLDELDERFSGWIKSECMHGDPETAHIEADDYLIALLIELGFAKTVDAYRGITKWYA